jgi:hypothetical protein
VNDPDDTNAGGAPEAPAQEVFTREQAEAMAETIANKRIAAIQAKQQQRRAAPAAPAGGSDISSTLDSLIKLKAIEMMNSMSQTQPRNEKPASDRGSPAAAPSLDDADLVTMSESDRSAYIKQKGLRGFTDKLREQLKGRKISTR